MGYLGRKVKAAAEAARRGDQTTAWSNLKADRGGRRCRGCGEEWSRMTKARIIAHAECDDEDGCPDT